MKIIPCFIFIFISFLAHSQIHYNKEILNTDGTNLENFILRGTSSSRNSLSVFIKENTADQFPGDNFLLIELDTIGGIKSSVKIGTPSVASFNAPFNFSKYGHKNMAAFRSNSPIDSFKVSLFIFDTNDNQTIAKQYFSGSISDGALSFSKNGTRIISSYNEDFLPVTELPQSLGLFTINSVTGEDIFSRHFSTVIPQPAYGFRARDIIGLNNNGYSIIGSTAQQSSFILQIDSSGNIEKSVGTLNENITFENHSQDDNGNLYLCGKIQNPINPTVDGYVMKLDTTLQTLWTQKIEIENFSCSKVNLSNLPNGNIFFTYFSLGTYPIVMGELLNSDGSLVWQKGFSQGGGFEAMKEKGSVFFTSKNKYLPSGELNLSLLVSSLDPLGNIPSCEQIDACIQESAINLVLENWEWESFNSAVPWDIETYIDPIELTTVSYCESPIEPSPYFFMPDTVCFGECLFPEELANEGANYTEWIISSDIIDSTIYDTSFIFCFDEPGIHEITQTIWVLGCPMSYTRPIFILPQLDINVNIDNVYCDSLPVTLTLNSNRELISFNWHDGSTESFFVALENGTVSIAATDGYCTDTDTATLEILLDSLVFEDILNFPKDTSICSENLPFILNVFSEYSDSILINEELIINNEITLIEFDEYMISAIIDGCKFDEIFTLNSISCTEDIYIPNIFTPNNDGVNDFWSPLGNNIEIIKYSIFNRWGAKVFESTNNEHLWDGNFKGKQLDSGVYIAKIEYVNVLTGKNFTKIEDVVLVK